MKYITPGGTIDFSFTADTGLTGTAGVRLVDSAGADTVARTTSGISEVGTTGVYVGTMTAPTTEGTYHLLIDDGAQTNGHIVVEEVTVTYTATALAASGGDYITSDELKAARELTGYTFADGQIPTTITAASRVVDKLCGKRRKFWPDANANTIRYYTAEHWKHVEVDDLITLTSLATDQTGDGTYETTWATTDYVLEPLNAAVETPARPYETIYVATQGRYCFPTIRSGVKVTGKFGWAAVPAEVWSATLILCVRYLLRLRESPAGIVSVGSALEGQVMRLARMDPDVPTLLADYSRKRIL